MYKVAVRKVRFKKVHEKVFFSIKTRFSRKFFELRIVWPWMLVRSKALIKADLLDTYNMFIRPTKNFLFASEVRWFQQIRTFSRIFNLKIGFLKSTRIQKCTVAYVCRNKNRFTHRMITLFVSADSYGRVALKPPQKVLKTGSLTLFWVFSNIFCDFLPQVSQYVLWRHGIMSQG